MHRLVIQSTVKQVAPFVIRMNSTKLRESTKMLAT